MPVHFTCRSCRHKHVPSHRAWGRGTKAAAVEHATDAAWSKLSSRHYSNLACSAALADHETGYVSHLVPFNSEADDNLALQCDHEMREDTMAVPLRKIVCRLHN
jgi:hypothetical protein